MRVLGALLLVLVVSLASSTALAAVGSAPAIIQQPQDVAVRIGESFRFLVTATGTAPLTYQWQFRATNLPAATNSDFSAPAAGMDNAGFYIVIVQNASGAVTSSPALLTIKSAAATPPPSFNWAQLTWPGSNSSVSFSDLAVGSSGNSFAVGSFSGRAFIGDTNPVMIVSQATLGGQGTDALLLNLDRSGRLQWFVRLPSPYVSGQAPSIWLPFAVCVDSFDNSYLIVGPGLGYGYGTPKTIVEYNNAGHGIWTNRVANSGEKIAVNASGRSVVLGYTNGVDSEYDGGILSLQSFDSSGNGSILTQFGGSGTRGYGLRVDQDGNILVSGRFTDSASFGAINLTSRGQSDGYIARFDNGGNVQWVTQIGGPDFDVAESVAVDNAGNVFVCGIFQGSVTFGTAALSTDGTGFFVAKLTPLGDVLWVRQAQLISDSNIASSHRLNARIAVDPAGRVSIAGRFNGVALFEGTALTARQSDDIFFAQYDPAGSLIRVERFAGGGAGQLFPPGIASDFQGATYLAGVTTPPGFVGNIPVTHSGLRSMFVAQMTTNFPQPWIVEQPVSRLGLTGHDVELSVEAVGVAPLSYQWRSSSSSVANQTNSTLLLPTVQLSDSGGFFVVVSNRFGAITSSVATLTVVSPPLISVQPSNQVVVLGSNATLSVSAGGTTPLLFQWRFNGLPLQGETNSSLLVQAAQPANQGIYSVAIGNAGGWVVSEGAALSVAAYTVTVSVAGNGTVLKVPNQAYFPPNATVTLTANPAQGSRLFAWSGDFSSTNNSITLVINTNKALQANFVSTVLNVTIQGNGSVTKAPDRSSYEIGEHVTLTATPARWYSLAQWDDGSTSNPRLVTIGANNSYSAFFSPTTTLETLTFSNVTRTAPVGMPAIFVDGAFVPTGSVTRVGSATVSITSTFNNGGLLYTLNGSAPSYDSILYRGPFTRGRTATVRALAYNFDFSRSWESDPIELVIVPAYTFNAHTAGGGIVNVAPVTGPYASNTLINVTAIPNPGWTFLQWLGDLAGTNNTRTVRMNEDKCIDAVFGTSFTTTVSGAGSIAVAPTGLLIPFGTTLQLTATPEAESYFSLWGNAASGSNNPLSFVVTNPNPAVSSLFGTLGAGQLSLTVIVHGSGHVLMNPRANRFNAGQNVSLTAIADPEQSFLNWTGDTVGSQTNLSLAMNQSRVVTANFTRRPKLSIWECSERAPAENFRFLVHGELNAHYQFESSSDLCTWTPRQNITNLWGTVQIDDSVGPPNTQRFFRIVSP